MHTIYLDANLPEPWSDNWMSFSGNENADVDVNHKKINNNNPVIKCKRFKAGLSQRVKCRVVFRLLSLGFLLE